MIKIVIELIEFCLDDLIIKNNFGRPVTGRPIIKQNTNLH